LDSEESYLSISPPLKFLIPTIRLCPSLKTGPFNILTVSMDPASVELRFKLLVLGNYLDVYFEEQILLLCSDPKS
jgi:hypothetical protein